MATRELRRSSVCAELLVIALTSGALEAGMSDFLTKPLEPAVLVRTLRRHIATGIREVAQEAADPLRPARQVARTRNAGGTPRRAQCVPSKGHFMDAPSHTLPAAAPRTPLRAAQWLLRALPYRRLHRATCDRQRLSKAHLDAQSPGLPQDRPLHERTASSEALSTAPDSTGTTRAAAAARQGEAPIAPGRGEAVAPSRRRQAPPVPDSEASLIGVTVRVAQPSDIGPLQQMYASLSTHTRAQRFFIPLRELPREMLNALESGDPAHRFLVVEGPEGKGNGTLLGLGQYAADPGQARCELALLIADEWQGRGLGTRLLRQLLQDAVASGLREARLETLHDNLAMRALARRAGFSVRAHPEDSLLLVGCRALGDRPGRSFSAPSVLSG